MTTKPIKSPPPTPGPIIVNQLVMDSLVRTGGTTKMINGERV